LRSSDFDSDFHRKFMGIQPMVFCALLGCLISLLIIPLILLPGLMRSLTVRRGSEERRFEGRDKTPTPVPGLGGIVLATSFLGVATLIYFLYPAAWMTKSHTNLAIVWTGLAMFFLGLWDDFRPLRAHWKVLVQTLISVAAYCQGVQIETFTNPLGGASYPLGVWSGLITVLWLLGLTNLIALAGRINGLAGGLGLVLLGLLAVAGFGSGAEFSALCAIGVAGALLGFLVYNFPPSRIRLEGGGACFVGFLIGSLTTVKPHSDARLSAMEVLFVLVLPLSGLGLAIWRVTPKGLPGAHLAPKHAHRRLLEISVPPARGRS
jgi:UDP-GlcNAc:undecaprenyl-phosphate GlcNAc-1-phosphate transferase